MNMVCEQRLRVAMTAEDGQQKDSVTITGSECRAIYDELVRRRKLIEGFEAMLGIEGESNTNPQD